MSTPELVKFTTSGVQAVAVDGPQFVLLTVPKMNGTFNEGGVRAGGAADDRPNWVDEYASGQFVYGGVGVQLFPLSMPGVPRKLVPVAKSPAVLKHCCPPQSAAVDDKSTCTFCACAGAAMTNNANASASSGRSATNLWQFRVIILVSSHPSRSRNSRIA